MNKFLACCADQRRALIAKQNVIQGIDFLEVSNDGKKLFLHFFPSAGKPALAPNGSNIVIEGGIRIKDIHAASVVDGPGPNASTVDVDRVGDFSIYKLRLVPTAGFPLTNIDPVFSEVEFFFRPECAGDFDCQVDDSCPPELREEPTLDYLAKDYSSFRRLMLDRMSLIAPDWKERSAADLGIALVELFAYVGDRLSYRQDAIATEAYLRTARNRISVRRHARLVDYGMHDGCNARVWVQVQVNDDNVMVSTDGLDKLTFLTKAAGFETRLTNTKNSYDAAIDRGARVFESMAGSGPFFKDHNEIEFYTWGSDECCLRQGATTATLRGTFPNLQPDDVLVFYERSGATTGEPQDAVKGKRHAVRLTSVTTTNDPLGDAITETPGPIPITEIQWHSEDALPFELCLSANGSYGISAVLGNIILADHGQTVVDPEMLPVIPMSELLRVPALALAHCGDPEPPKKVPARYRPRLKLGPVTQQGYVLPSGTLPGESADHVLFDPQGPATRAFDWSPATAVPEIWLEDLNSLAPKTWRPVRDLISSVGSDTHFVLEVDNASVAWLRFGDDECGDRPTAEEEIGFNAFYRVGNGVEGNIPLESIAHVVTQDARVTRVWNPMAAAGGVDPESIEAVRRDAPVAFREIQLRAVTEVDYATFAAKHPMVQRATATFRWTGSWKTVFVVVDLKDNQKLTAALEQEIVVFLDRYRMAGHDIEVVPPTLVPLDIAVTVCVEPQVVATDVAIKLRRIFSNQTDDLGNPGVFHPDRLSFGQKVFLSTIYAAAQAVEGVRSVQVTKFQRLGDENGTGIADGYLEFSGAEIPVLDNDPNYPDLGIFAVNAIGGR